MNSEVATSPSRPVVVGVDGSRCAAAAVDLAAAEAARCGAPLLVVHVWPGRYRGMFRSAGVVASRADGRNLLDVLMRRARLAIPDLPIGTELLEGAAAAVLADCSARAQLLVTGFRDDPLVRSSWGSTAAYLAHHCQCPLMVNRGAGHDGPVVVASSARHPAPASLGYAFAEAAILGSPLVAVHMWARPGGGDGPVPVVVRGGYAIERREAADRLEHALDDWSVRFPQVKVERLVVSDVDMAGTIESASRRGRLLIGGIGRHGLFSELLYGPPGVTVCPVVLVPEGWPVGRP